MFLHPNIVVSFDQQKFEPLKYFWIYFCYCEFIQSTSPHRDTLLVASYHTQGNGGRILPPPTTGGALKVCFDSSKCMASLITMTDLINITAINLTKYELLDATKGSVGQEIFFPFLMNSNLKFSTLSQYIIQSNWSIVQKFFRSYRKYASSHKYIIELFHVLTAVNWQIFISC